MKKINIVCYSEKIEHGGIETYIINLFKNLDNSKFNFTIMCSQKLTDRYDNEVQSRGSKIVVTLQKIYKSPILRTINNFYAFYKTIKKMDCDILHLNVCNSVTMAYGCIAKKCGVKNVIFHSHSSNISNNARILKLIAHKIFKLIFEKYGTCYIACSDLAAKWLYSENIIRQNKVKILNNPVDFSKFKYDETLRENIRHELGLENKFVIGNIGRFNKEKNHIFLINVFEEILKINDNSILFLVGQGELKANIEKLVSEKKISDKVIFYGVTEDIYICYLVMDVFVLTSHFEGNPITAMEAQSYGLKCFLSSSITRQADITNSIEMISLNKSPEYWAYEILKHSDNYNRSYIYNKIKIDDYNINNVTNKMQEIYSNLMKE
ncbi:MAG: glycosyltransferase [Clostridia bacterium]|nr:glycosyltransferase [Clostridia bacterium]